MPRQHTLAVLIAMQDFYLEDVLKFIGYKAPANYAPKQAENGKTSGALARLQAAATEQAIMDAFLTGGEDHWQQLLEVTGAQEGGGNPVSINATHAATGVAKLHYRLYSSHRQLLNPNWGSFKGGVRIEHLSVSARICW